MIIFKINENEIKNSMEQNFKFTVVFVKITTLLINNQNQINR